MDRRAAFSIFLLVLAAAPAMPAFQCPILAPASVAPSEDAFKTKPSVDGAFKFIGGDRAPWSGQLTEVTSPILDSSTGKRAVIGRVAAFEEADAVQAVEAAAKAWDRGQGRWPQLPLCERIAAIQRFVEHLKPARESIVHALMWEICKNSTDAAAEFDRTMKFVGSVIEALEASDENEAFGKWTTVAGVRGRMRRGPVGVTMMLAPFNYPLNEMYAMMIPALLMGNIIVLKLPAIGGLAHILTVDAIEKALPPGVVNFVTGAGRKTMGPIMKTGLVDCLGFIGGAKATDALIVQHPQPHRLKVFSQLEGKNIAVVLADADLEVAAAQIVLGSLTYNGQRCTACKLVMVHEAIAESLVDKLATRIDALKRGLPWEGASITPLPEPAKPDYLESVIADAVEKGARVVNAAAGGGSRAGALFTPAVVYPVAPGMRLFSEEQFGPVVPIAKFSDTAEVDAAVRASWNGQQAAIFTTSAAKAAPLIDNLSTVVGRININSQCSRGPDVFPFSGRRSSAMGTMSVTEALRAFSVETIVTFPDSVVNRHIAEGMEAEAKFFQPIKKQKCS
jgi:glyceraldehyde-3-phosphate dehydrogenase (NADP+)